jgi:hypothetical protein
MTALLGDRGTVERSGDTLVLNAAATKKYFAGALIARDANGRATPGAVATTLRGVGRCEDFVDNSFGANDAVTVRIRKGIFRYANSAAADQVTAADIGKSCYIMDDQTVAKTDGGGTRSVAGNVFDVDAQGVWVDFRFDKTLS